MPEPISSTTATFFSLGKILSIVAGICGSIIPILALADRAKIRMVNAFFMAITGSSFSIFVGPWLALKLEMNSLEGIVALSWFMGASGVFLVRAIFKWLDKRGFDVIDRIANKFIGTDSSTSDNEKGEQR